MISKSIPQNSENKGFKSESGFLEIINDLQDGYFEIDLAGNLQVINSAVSRLFGYSEKELIGMNNRDYMEPSVAKEVYLQFNRVYRTGKPEKGIEYEVIKKNRERATVDVSVSLIKDKDNNSIGFRGVIRDVTNRKRLEDQLRLSEMRYRSILGEINELYFETDLKGVISFCNSAVEESLEYSNGEVVGSDYSCFVSEESKVTYDEASKLIKENKTPSQVELFLKTKSGNKICVESRIFAITDKEGLIKGFRGVARDITARKRVEESLIDYKSHLEEKVEKRTLELSEAKIAAEKASHAKTEFLANISHELRTPLHGILSFSRFGIEKLSDSEEDNISRYFRKIYQSGHRLMFLVEDLLEIANLESGKIRFNMARNDLIDITHFVMQGFESNSAEKNIAIVTKNTAKSTQIICDSNKIAHVIKNLLSNAIRYSEQNTKISILVEDSFLEIDKSNESALTFSITDQGVGIPESELVNVFEKFKQSSRTNTGAGGVGLGLSICKEIVLGHKGRIWAELMPEAGTKVSFTIPSKFNIE